MLIVIYMSLMAYMPFMETATLKMIASELLMCPCACIGESRGSCPL